VKRSFFIRTLFILIIMLFSNIYAGNNGSAVFVNNAQFYLSDENKNNPDADPTAYMITGSTITLEAWVFLMGPMENPYGINQIKVVSRDFYNDNQEWSSYALSILNINDPFNPKIEFSISDGGAPANIGSVEYSVSDRQEEWLHIAATYDGSSMKLYLNGQIVNTSSFAGTIGEGANGGFRIGDSFFWGLIDDVRLWDIPRSASEIANNMNNQLTGQESGLKGYWPLNRIVEYFTPDSTNYQNDLRDNKVLISKFSHNNASGTFAQINVDTSPIHFGAIETGLLSEGRTITIVNDGDYPLYGQLLSTNVDIKVSDYKYNVSTVNYYCDPGDEFILEIFVQPQIGGALAGTIIFDEGNANNLGVEIPISVNSVKLNKIDANNISMWMQRNGRFARNPFTGDSGLEWPKDSGKYAVFTSGVWLGAKINEEIHTAEARHHSEFGPGPIVDGQAADPDDPIYHVYKIQSGDNAGNNEDYANWPTDLGAPVNADGSPMIIGNQTLFVVYNDADAELHTQNTPPLGAEIQQTVFGYTETGPLENTVFLRFKIINKSDDIWEDSYFAVWSDPDLGTAFDDLIGIDTTRNLAYDYNGNSQDQVYGTDIPAVGYDMLKGAYYSKPIQAFAYYTAGAQYPYNDPVNGIESYNFMSGFLADGSPYIDPTTQLPSSFPFNGDPVAGNGWLDSNPADRRFLLSTGPFTLEPGQAHELIAAIIVAQGDNYLDSITKLKEASDAIQALYDGGQIFGGMVENVTVTELEPDETGTIDDIESSGAEIGITAGSDGATVEVATFSEPPTGAENIESSSIQGVGNYIDIQVEGDVTWPADLKIYYTDDDLQQAEITEGELVGIYYWNSVNTDWVLYSDSGDDDQGRGPSETGVNTENITIENVDYEGYVWATAYHFTSIRIGTEIVISIKDTENSGIPTKFALNQNYPNPFNPITQIAFDLPKSEFVSINIYSISGELITNLFNGQKTAGSHQLQFDGSKLASGIYFYTIQAGSFSTSRKMLLLK